MKDQHLEDRVAALIAGILLGVTLTIYILGSIHGNSIENFKDEAVKRGHAEYIVTSHKTVIFKWNDKN